MRGVPLSATGNLTLDGTNTLSHSIDIPYYNNITSASLTVYYDNKSTSANTLNVYVNGNYVGSFTMGVGAGSYTFTGIEAYLIPNATNTFSYTATGAANITQTTITYDHDLTLVRQPDGCWALGFDGVNDYIAIQNMHYSTAGEIGEITVCAWVKSDSTKRQIIASFDRSEYWRLALVDDSAADKTAWDTTSSSGKTNDLGTPNLYTNGKFHFICGWFKAGGSPDKKIYVDGEVVASATAHNGEGLGRGVYTRYGFIGVGSEASKYNGAKGPLLYFKGLMSSFYIIHRALDENEVKLSSEFRTAHRFSSQPSIMATSIPVIDLSSSQTVTVSFTESASGNAYLPIPVAAKNVKPANWVYTVDGDVLQFDDNRYVEASSVTFEIPLRVNSYVVENLPDELYLEHHESKTFEYRQRVTISNPSDIEVLATLSVDPAVIGTKEVYLDGIPMTLHNGTLITSVRLNPGETKTFEVTAKLPVTVESNKFRATLDDFFEIQSYEDALKIAQNSVEGKIDTVVEVLKIDLPDLGNKSVIYPIDVKPTDVIEARALTGSKELLEIREGKDGKAEIVVPPTAFNSTDSDLYHAEVKVIYTKKPAWWERLPFLKNLSGIFEFLKKLFGGVG